MVIAGDGPIDYFTCWLSSDGSYLTLTSKVVGLVGGPVSLVDSGAVVACRVSGSVYTATLTVLGG